MNVLLSNCYYLAYFNIEAIKGSVFINAIVLGSAEVLSMLASGLLLLKFTEDVALKICCAIAIAANLLLTQAMSVN
jgi:hypothetical protein